MTPLAAAVETHSLGCRYGRFWALRDCSLSVPAGSVTALVGPNGAGKTTLLHLLVGLCAPSAGDAACSAGRRANTRCSSCRAWDSSPRTTRFIEASGSVRC